MTQEEDDNGSIPKEQNGLNIPQSSNRSVWLRAFGLRRSPQTPRSSRSGDHGFRSKQKDGMGDSRNGSGKASRSSGTLKKTKTFSGIFRRGKGKISVEEVAGEPEDDFETMQPLPCSESSSSEKGNNIEEENPDYVSRLDRLRLMKVSLANRTMFFKGDIPPCSPLSTKGQTSSVTVALRGGGKRNATDAESGYLKQRLLDVETSRQEDEKQKDPTFDSETRELQNDRASTRASNAVNVLNMRLGSIAFEPEQSVSPLKSSPLPSPRKMLSRLSSSPKHKRKSFERQTSATHENHDRTRNRVRMEHDSPWGVQDMGETEREGHDRHSSGKSFRRLSMALRLTRKKSTHSSSNSLNLSDEETC